MDSDDSINPRPRQFSYHQLVLAHGFSPMACQSSAYLRTPISPEEDYQPLRLPTTPTVAIKNSSSTHSSLDYTLLPGHFVSISSSMQCLQG